MCVFLYEHTKKVSPEIVPRLDSVQVFRSVLGYNKKITNISFSHLISWFQYSDQLYIAPVACRNIFF